MTHLNRQLLLKDLTEVMAKQDALRGRSDAFGAAAQIRHGAAARLKDNIEAGVYDVPGASAQEYFLDTLRARWFALTPRQRQKLYDLDSLLQISIRHLADPQKTRSLNAPAEEHELVEADEVLDTPKPRKSPWFWPLWALCGLLVVVLGGTTVSLLMGGV